MKEMNAKDFAFPYVVIKQEWEESERGWGVRPDGCSLHLFESDRVSFVDQFLANQHKHFTDSGVTGVPDEYTRVSGNPTNFVTDKETYLLLLEKRKQGILGIWAE